MQDQEIVNLFFQRDERGIEEAKKKYAGYVRKIASNVRHAAEDVEECENDAYLGAWNSIPPQRPEDLRTYLGKLVRRISIDRFRRETAEKRGGTETALSLDELEDCLSFGAESPVEREVERRELSRFIDAFLRKLPDTERRLFLRKYWYMESIETLSERFGFSESKVKSMLFRTRGKLKAALEKARFDHE